MKVKLVIMAAILLLSPSLTSEKQINGNVLYVGGNGEGNYTSIQAAINVAKDGDTIYVYPGYYNESIVISKSISLIGIVENGEKPVIHGIENESALVINADKCVLKNFVLKSKELKIAPHISPSCVIRSNNNIIENNTFMYGWCSLYLYESSYNTIKNNTITKGYWEGLFTRKCSYNIFMFNKAENNMGDGLFFSQEKGSKIIDNIITNSSHGMVVSLSNNCTISSNHVYKNHGDGINLDGCENITVKNNTLHDNSVAGIQMMDCHYCVVEENEMYRNQGGIMVQSSYAGYNIHKQYNIIRRNNISYNKDVGVYIESSIMNVFEENNLMHNKINAWIAWYEATIDMSYLKDFPFHPCHNTWHANYWSDWRFHAPKPIRGFLEIDVLVFNRDIFYATIPCYNFDFHPAMEPYKM